MREKLASLQPTQYDHVRQAIPHRQSEIKIIRDIFNNDYDLKLIYVPLYTSMAIQKTDQRQNMQSVNTTHDSFNDGMIKIKQVTEVNRNIRSSRVVVFKVKSV